MNNEELNGILYIPTAQLPKEGEMYRQAYIYKEEPNFETTPYISVNDAEEMSPHWHDARLVVPKDDDDVIVVDEEGFFHVAYYSKPTNEWYTNNGHKIAVDAWIEIPFLIMEEYSHGSQDSCN